MLEKDCIFCKILNGDIPSTTLYEDEDFRVIFDVSPASRGHVIMLPKTHSANLFELSDEMASKAIVLAKKIATVLKEYLNCDGINLVQNNGVAAGQTEFHFHLHIIPRFDGDGAMIHWKAGTLDAADAQDIANDLHNLL